MSEPATARPPAGARPRCTALDVRAIVATADRLERRVAERFPARGLRQVARDLAVLVREHEARAADIRRPAWGVRAWIVGLLLAAAAAVTLLLRGLHTERIAWTATDGPALLQALEAGLGTLVFLGAALVFLFSLELRAKRRRALEALHELRALAHVIDMHQLTKDPDRSLGRLAPTPSSPSADLTAAELARYLDYCSEMLALIGKVAAVYVQHLPDPVAVSAVDDVESLTGGLATRIGQKLQLLGSAPPATPPAAPPP